MLRELADGPRRLVTTEWPSPLDGGVVMVVALALALVTAIAAELAGRPRFHVAPLGSMMVGFTAAMAISAPVHPSRWPLAALAAGAVLLLFSRPGTDPRSRLRLLLGERSLMITLGGLLLAGIIAASTIAWTDRADPRQEVDADVTLSLLDPVEQMVALRLAEPEFDMFKHHRPLRAHRAVAAHPLAAVGARPVRRSALAAGRHPAPDRQPAGAADAGQPRPGPADHLRPDDPHRRHQSRSRSPAGRSSSTAATTR